MNRQEAENYVYQSYLKAARFQDFQIKDEFKRKPQLSKKIIEELSDTPCVVVTGSKGKGSISSMIAQILQSEKKVGLMTSPHLVDFCERFKVNGKDMSDEKFIHHIEQVKKSFDLVENEIAQQECISPMGIQAAVALSYFREQQTQFNVFECGKGAKYDDVNNIVHDYAVINSIFLEHTRELGMTLAEIAENKSAVINGNQKCVYVAEQNPEVLEIIRKRAAEKNVMLKVYGEDFYAQNICFTNTGMVFDVVIGSSLFQEISIPLLGEHQARNTALALAVGLDILDYVNMDEIKIKLKQLDWPGRMEVLSSKPFVMLDACINRESCIELCKVAKELKLEKVTAIVGIPDDKDYLGVIKEVSLISDQIILTKSQNPHYQFTNKQSENLKKEGISFFYFENIEEALHGAMKKGMPTIILGTTSLISEVKKLQCKLKNNGYGEWQ